MKPAPKTSASQHEDFHAANDCGLGGLVLRLTECADRDHPLSPREPGSPHREAAKAALEAAFRAERRMAEQQRRIARLERLAATDELTGVLNRRGFESALKRHLAEARRHHEPGVLVIVDLDGFKPINDTHGHRAGDEVLRRVARLLMDNVRETDYVGRLGGDEFAVLLTRTSHVDGIDRAECLDQRVNGMSVAWDGRMIAPRASFGFQTYGPGDDGEELIGQADEAMYRIKRARARLGKGSANPRQPLAGTQPTSLTTTVPSPSLAASPRAAECGRGVLFSDSGKASGRHGRAEDRP